MQTDKTHVTVRLVSIAVIVLTVVGALGWLRYDLGRETFYTALIFVLGIGVTVFIALISGIGFRMAQRSDNVDVAMAGAFREMMQLLAVQQRSNVEEWKALNQQAQIAASQQQPVALPWFDEDDDDEDDESNTTVATEWVGWGADVQ